MPQGEHSSIQVDLCEAINQVAKTQKIAKAFPEWRCTFDGRSIVPEIFLYFAGRGFLANLPGELLIA